MFVIHPRRHDEDVALLPVEALAVDDRMALSLGALIDEAAGLAVRLCALAGAQQLHRRADGRHDGSPGGRVHIIHDDAVIGRTVDRKSTRLNSSTTAPLVCRLLL